MSVPVRGELYLVDFLYAESDRSKRRPACVVTTELFNRGPDVLLAMVTSNRRRVTNPGLGDAVVEGWAAACLKVRSVVRTGRLLAVQRTMLDARLGLLEVADRQAMDRALAEVLGLA